MNLSSRIWPLGESWVTPGFNFLPGTQRTQLAAAQNRACACSLSAPLTALTTEGVSFPSEGAGEETAQWPACWVISAGRSLRCKNLSLWSLSTMHQKQRGYHIKGNLSESNIYLFQSPNKDFQGQFYKVEYI